MSKGVPEEKLSIKRAEIIRGEWKPKKVQISFPKFKEQHLEFSLTNKKQRTPKRDVVSLGPLQKFFGGRSLSEINPFMIEKYKQKGKEDGVSVRTINIELVCLRHMFNVAIKWIRYRRIRSRRSSSSRNRKERIAYFHPRKKLD